MVGENKRSLRLVVFGQTGYGKSYFIKNKVIPSFRRVVVFDPDNEYGRSKDFKGILEVTETREEFLRFARYSWGLKDFQVRHVPSDESDDDEDELIFDIIWRLKDCTLIVDEAHYFCHDKDLQRIARRGRKKGIDLITIAHRPADVPRIFTAMGDITVTFRMSEKIDIEGFKHYVDMERANKAMSLNVGEYIVLKRPPSGINLSDGLKKGGNHTIAY